MRSKISFIQRTISLAQMLFILYRPIKSSCSSSSEYTHLIHIDNCSLFEESVHSTHIMLKVSRWCNIICYLSGMQESHHFEDFICISWDTYLLVFLSIQSLILGSSFWRNLRSCIKFELLSSPSPLRAMPCL